MVKVGWTQSCFPSRFCSGVWWFGCVSTPLWICQSTFSCGIWVEICQDGFLSTQPAAQCLWFILMVDYHEINSRRFRYKHSLDSWSAKRPARVIYHLEHLRTLRVVWGRMIHVFEGLNIWCSCSDPPWFPGDLRHYARTDFMGGAFLWELDAMAAVRASLCQESKKQYIYVYIYMYVQTLVCISIHIYIYIDIYI